MGNVDSGLPRDTYRLINDTRGIEIAGHIRRAETLWQRLIGLLSRSRLNPGEGLWIEPCNGIHTLGMRFSIDVVMLDRRGCVLGIHHQVPPFRIIRRRSGWMGTVELRPGDLGPDTIQIGDKLRLSE
jgi:uncharacterized membrane protein (UPF0127 family)